MSDEHRFTASVTWDATERSGALASGSGHLSTTFGGAPSLGGRVDRTNPEELLLGALLACFVQTWAIFLTKLRLPVESPRVDGTLELGVDPAGGYRVDADPPLRVRPRGAPRGARSRRGEDAGARREVLHRLEGGEGRGTRGARHAGRGLSRRRASRPSERFRSRAAEDGDTGETGEKRPVPVHFIVPHESRVGGMSHGGSSARATRIGSAARAAGASANASLRSLHARARLIRRPARGAVRGPARARTPLAGHPSHPLRPRRAASRRDLANRSSVSSSDPPDYEFGEQALGEPRGRRRRLPIEC